MGSEYKLNSSLTTQPDHYLPHSLPSKNDAKEKDQRANSSVFFRISVHQNLICINLDFL